MALCCFCLGLFCFFSVLVLSVFCYWPTLDICIVCRTSCRCSDSYSSSLELEHTALTLCLRVLITLYLQARLWWLCHWRYRSVWVGFLEILVVKVPSSWGVTIVSGKGMEPSCFASSVLNWMDASTELMCCRNSSLYDCFNMAIVSSTYPFHHLGWSSADVRALSSKIPCINLPLQGSHETP